MHLFKSPTNLSCSLLLVGPRRKQTDRGQRSIFPSETTQFVPCILAPRHGFSRPTPRSPAHLPFPERTWCLLTGSSPLSHFPRRYASFGAMTAGTNGLAYGFNWQCTANDVGYAVSWSKYAWTRYRLITSTVLSTPAGRQPGQACQGKGRTHKTRDYLRLHYTRLFPDPRFLLFVLQNIAGYKNAVECLLQ